MQCQMIGDMMLRTVVHQVGGTTRSEHMLEVRDIKCDWSRVLFQGRIVHRSFIITELFLIKDRPLHNTI